MCIVEVVEGEEATGAVAEVDVMTQIDDGGSARGNGDYG
jgi:hypothetical protein